MHVCVFVFVFFSHCVHLLLLPSFTLLPCCFVVVVEHSFVILLRATDWLNVYLFVVRAHHFVMIVVVAAVARTCV